MNGKLTAKQRARLAKASGKQRAALQRAYAAQNSNRGSGGGTGAPNGAPGRQNHAAARPTRNRRRGAVQYGSVHARALNPFDNSVPGYQLNPMAEMTIKRRLIADVPVYVSPHEVADAPGCAYLTLDANAVSCGKRSWADIPNGGGVPFTNEVTIDWVGSITGLDYVVRGVNFGVELSYSGQALFQAGDIAFLLVEADASTTSASPAALMGAVNYVFEHPRAKILPVRAIADRPVRISVPIEDDLRYRAWKQSPTSDPSPDIIHPTFENNVYSGSNFGFRTLVIAIRNAVRTTLTNATVMPSFRARIVADVEYRGDNNKNDPGSNALQRYHATQSPKVPPHTAYSIMDRIGHYAGVVGDVLSHPAFSRGVQMLQDLPMLAL